jgi:hypothetical protein
LSFSHSYKKEKIERRNAAGGATLLTSALVFVVVIISGLVGLGVAWRGAKISGLGGAAGLFKALAKSLIRRCGLLILGGRVCADDYGGVGSLGTDLLPSRRPTIDLLYRRIGLYER